MIRVSFCHVSDENVERLRDWMRQLSKRRDEVLETFAQEGSLHEQAFLIDGRDGHVLVYAMQADDHQKAGEAFRNSTLPIDIEHRKVMREVCGERIKPELLWECADSDQ